MTMLMAPRREDVPYSSCRTFENFYTLNFANVNGEIEGVVSCLRVADVDAVEEDCDLFVVAATYAHVGLRSNWSALTDINACGVFQQIVNTLHWSRLNVGTFQYSYHSCSLGSCEWRT